MILDKYFLTSEMDTMISCKVCFTSSDGRSIDTNVFTLPETEMTHVAIENFVRTMEVLQLPTQERIEKIIEANKNGK